MTVTEQNDSCIKSSATTDSRKHPDTTYKHSNREKARREGDGDGVTEERQTEKRQQNNDSNRETIKQSHIPLRALAQHTADIDSQTSRLGKLTVRVSEQFQLVTGTCIACLWAREMTKERRKMSER